MRAAFPSLPLVLALAWQPACVKPAPPAHVFRIGDRVPVGPLVYNILDADWRAQIGYGSQVRVPARRFLIVHLSVTNGGAEVLSMPVLRLVDETGHAYVESMDGMNVPSWL